MLICSGIFTSRKTFLNSFFSSPAGLTFFSFSLALIAGLNTISPLSSLADDSPNLGTWGVRKIKVTPTGRIKVTLCKAWGTPSGYIDIGGKPYYVADASRVNRKSIIWNTSDRYEKKGEYQVNTSNLFATTKTPPHKKYVVPVNIGCGKAFKALVGGTASKGAAATSVVATGGTKAAGAIATGAVTAGTIAAAGVTSSAVIAPVVVGAGMGSAAAIIGGAIAIGVGAAASGGFGGSSSN